MHSNVLFQPGTLIHAPNDIAFVRLWKGGESGIDTEPVPSKLNAYPTSPGAYVTLFWSVPLFVPARSSVVRLPGHQEIRPEGANTEQSGEILKTTVNVA